ncbi:outer membrane beta-barrel protein [Methyloglobulus sp.]|uniref:outer membrane protein n=1 Tax=Methyloglobulus sp. TaxID=2518622 RepID=UPI0032B7F8E7
MCILQKLRCSALMLAGLAIATSADAEEHKAYVQFNAGAAFAPSDSVDGSLTGCTFSGASPSYCFNLKTHFIQDYDPGFAGSLALGYQVADQFRLEGEVLYQSNDNGKEHFSLSIQPVTRHSHGPSLPSSAPSKGDRERMAFLLNGYYDFKNSTAFTPYITAGMGGYHLRVKRPYGNAENDLDFAWAAGAGVNYKLDDRISFDLKYRYFGGADADLKGRLYEVGDHQVMAGIRVGF